MNKVSVLLLTGANNHDWKRSAPFLKKVLEDSGRFEVTMTEDPSSTLGDLASFGRHQVFLIDYNGPMWSDTARDNFLAAVKRGTGVVAVHAANNSFPEWKEYEKMIGLMWRPESGHGQFHEFEVRITDHTHPITQGLPDFKITDELYHRLVPIPGVDLKVLATAMSHEQTGGTGRAEPVMTVTQYGEGRVFYQALGHLWAGVPTNGYIGCTLIALENPSFKETLLRGCEWAATGAVGPTSQK
ncbi:MAG: Trehalose utilization [Verrucomicrobia bacterium]|nr:Trehalose utilization [Verrucomicrobiota bacterium]